MKILLFSLLIYQGKKQSPSQAAVAHWQNWSLVPNELCGVPVYFPASAPIQRGKRGKLISVTILQQFWI